MTNETASHRQRDRRRCGTGRERRAGEGLLEEGRQPEEGRAQGQENRQEAAPPKKEAKSAPKKAAKEKAPTQKSIQAGHRIPRDGSKKGIVMELLRRKEGATLAEIAKATDWQNHSIRGFISGQLTKKMGLTVESSKNEAGERTYKLAK